MFRTVLMSDIRALRPGTSLPGVALAARARTAPFYGPDKDAFHRSAAALEHNVSFEGRSRGVHALLALRTDAAMRRLYANPFGQCRFGRILEDFDAITATMALEHVGRQDVNCVTVAVDGVRVLTDLDEWKIDEDIHYYSVLNWTGRTSMEVSVVVMQSGRRLAETEFLFVARNKEGTASIPVPAFHPETEADAVAHTLASIRQQARVTRSKNSLAVSIPSLDEQQILHSLHLRGLDQNTEVPMKLAKYSSINIVQQDERNLYGFMFGGVILRRGFELAHVACTLHGGARPAVLQMNDSTFVKSVPIGSVFSLDAQISYCDPRQGLAVVSVDAAVHAPCKQGHHHHEHEDINAHGLKEITTTMNFAFRIPPGSRAVYPTSYDQCMRYLAGRRLSQRLEVQKA